MEPFCLELIFKDGTKYTIYGSEEQMREAYEELSRELETEIKKTIKIIGIINTVEQKNCQMIFVVDSIMAITYYKY